MVSLGWWVLAQDESEDSKVNEAIKDFTWVIKDLVSLLAVTADPDSAPSSSLPRRNPIKIGPPVRRPRRTRA